MPVLTKGIYNPGQREDVNIEEPAIVVGAYMTMRLYG